MSWYQSVFELQVHQEFQGGFVIAREFLKVIDCMFVRDEPHDSDSFSELFPQYSLFKREIKGIGRIRKCIHFQSKILLERRFFGCIN